MLVMLFNTTCLRIIFSSGLLHTVLPLQARDSGQEGRAYVMV